MEGGVESIDDALIIQAMIVYKHNTAVCVEARHPIVQSIWEPTVTTCAVIQPAPH